MSKLDDIINIQTLLHPLSTLYYLNIVIFSHFSNRSPDPNTFNIMLQLFDLKNFGMDFVSYNFQKI